ncbi:MAG: hypothetical protein L0Y58_09055 [Verrucomicrobia subdivision 3 bacterium]|nr:hypothetical protein [Limisphaerales bacterium]
MTERQRQTAFLKSLLKDGTDECKRLKDRILKAEHDENCIRRALILMMAVGGLSIVGIGYSAVLLPGFFDNATPLLVKIFCALGLGSLICMVIFGVCWGWYRQATNQITQDCRNFVKRHLRLGSTETTFISASSVKNQTADVYRIETDEPTPESRIIHLPRPTATSQSLAEPYQSRDAS